MILGLDHVAIAVPDLDAAVRRFVEDLGLQLDHVEDVVTAETRTAFLPVSGCVRTSGCNTGSGFFSCCASADCPE